VGQSAEGRSRCRLFEGGLPPLRGLHPLHADRREFLSWQFSIDQHGLAGLRTTRIPHYAKIPLKNPYYLMKTLRFAKPIFLML